MNEQPALKDNTFHLVAYLLSVVIGLIGIGTLFGWYYNINLLKAGLPNFISMKPNTALAFILISISFILSQYNQNKLGALSFIIRALGILIFMIGALTFAEYVFGFQFHIDQLLFSESTPAIFHPPGRMSPITTIIFMMIGACIFLLYLKHTMIICQTLAIIVGFLGIMILSAFTYNYSPSVYKIIPFFYASVHASINFVLTAIVICCLYPRNGIIALLRSKMVGGRMMRWMLPASILIPFILGYLRVWGQTKGFYDAGSGTAFFAISLMVIFFILIFFIFSILIRREQQITIQYHIASAIAEAEDFYLFAEEVLHIICKFLGWNSGEVWLVDSADNTLHFVTRWPNNVEERTTESGKKTLKLDEGLPGYIWKIKKPYWSLNINKEKNISLEAHFRKKMKSFFAFPVMAGDEVLAIILFYANNMIKPNVSLLGMFDVISIQIGRFIKSKQIEKNLFYLERYDVLTGLVNKFEFENNLTEAIATAKRCRHRVALFYLDIDYFQRMNDAAGSASGDRLLQQMANRLHQNMSKLGVVSRFGGDEFAILLPKITEHYDVKIVADKILKIISLPFKVDGRSLFITASMGISIYPDDGDTAKKLLSSADTAMHQVKNQGGNSYQFSFSGMMDVVRKKFMLENRLRNALKNNEFILHYQPIVDIKSKKIMGFEALIRWPQNDGQMMMSEEFISLAEKVNLVDQLDEFVLRTACLQTKKWQREGLGEITIAVNFSVRELDENFAKKIKKTLAETKLDAKYLHVELTENALMQVTEKNLSILMDLKNIGIKLCIDDFGTGYSSFSYLTNFSVDIVKVDQSFIRDIVNNLKIKEIVLAMIVMSHAVNAKIIAEGVETKKQLEILAEIGCDQCQGYLLGKPMPMQNVSQFFIKFNEQEN